MSFNESAAPSGWFACKVTSGYELKVVGELLKLTKHPEWGKFIFDVFAPARIVVDKKGKEKLDILIKENIYVKMTLTPDVYSVISIDGFRTPLPPKNPVPVPEEQMKNLLRFKKTL